MDSVGALINVAATRRPAMAPIVACYYAVREMPYALDGAHDALELLGQHRGDCLAKSELLGLAAKFLGFPARYVRWRYQLPDVVPETAHLSSRIDLHRAVQLRLAAKWVLVDCTHQAALRGTPLVVSDWDGQRDTEPAYPPMGDLIIEALDPARVSDACEEIRQWTASCPAALSAWRIAYSAWLSQYEKPCG